MAGATEPNCLTLLGFGLTGKKEKKKKICYCITVNVPSPELGGARGKCSWEDEEMAVPGTTGTWAAPDSFAV